MAAKEGFGGRAIGRLIAWLAVPRAATFPALLAIGLSVGEAAWQLVDSVKLLAWASGMAAPFCMICATSAWALRDRMVEVIDTDQMTSAEYARFDELVTKQRSRATFWAGVTALMALFAAGPAISNQLVGPVWHWSTLAAGAAVTCSVYSYQLANYWDLQIRAFKSKQKLEAMKRREKDELLAQIVSAANSSKERGWIEAPSLFDPKKSH